MPPSLLGPCPVFAERFPKIVGDRPPYSQNCRENEGFPARFIFRPTRKSVRFSNSRGRAARKQTVCSQSTFRDGGTSAPPFRRTYFFGRRRARGERSGAEAGSGVTIAAKRSLWRAGAVERDRPSVSARFRRECARAELRDGELVISNAGENRRGQIELPSEQGACSLHSMGSWSATLEKSRRPWMPLLEPRRPAIPPHTGRRSLDATPTNLAPLRSVSAMRPGSPLSGDRCQAMPRHDTRGQFGAQILLQRFPASPKPSPRNLPEKTPKFRRRKELQQRKARDSNPQPLARHLNSNQAASQFAYLPKGAIGCQLSAIGSWPIADSRWPTASTSLSRSRLESR